MIAEQWVELFAFAVFAVQPAAGDARAAAEGVLSPHALAGLRVHRLVDELAPPRAVMRCYKQATGPRVIAVAPPRGAPETVTYAVWALAAAQEAADGSAAQPPPAPLRDFLDALLRDPELKRAPGNRATLPGKVRDCWTEVAGRLGLDEPVDSPADARAGAAADAPADAPAGAAAEPAAEPREIYSIAIKLEEAIGWTPAKPLWTREAWLHRHGTTVWQRADAHVPLLRESSEPTGAYLEAVRNWVADRVPTLEGVIFEFFVDRKFLGRAFFDEWEVPVDVATSRIGFENPVVVRVAGRAGAIKDKVRQRWSRLAAAGSLDGDRHTVTHTTDGTIDSLYPKFAANKDLLCLIVDPARGPRRIVGQVPVRAGGGDCGFAGDHLAPAEPGGAGLAGQGGRVGPARPAHPAVTRA